MLRPGIVGMRGYMAMLLSELCTPRSGRAGSDTAVTDRMGTARAESVGRADLSLEGEERRGLRGGRAGATDGLAGGGSN